MVNKKKFIEKNDSQFYKDCDDNICLIMVIRILNMKALLKDYLYIMLIILYNCSSIVPQQHSEPSNMANDR